MPRAELELVDEATAHLAHAAAANPWDDLDDEDDQFDDWQIEDVVVETEPGGKPAFGVAAAAITTAAALERGRDALATGGVPGDAESPLAKAPQPLPAPRVSPDVFQQGMTVLHPAYGPGKIVALSGSGKNRRATIQFATVGEKKIVLAHSAVRPAR